jgi:isopentenyl-diphosphate Delta-isomerase
VTAAGEERVVLLDDDGRSIGTALKGEVHHRRTPLHLAFSCYIFDPAGRRLLLTRRALHKRTWPGVWTNSCCGHPAPGEPVEEAVVRRVAQELGAELTGLRLLLPDFRYRAVMEDGTVENELCPVYVATCPDPRALSPDPDEVDSVEWVDWRDFRADVLAGRREVSPWCVAQIAAIPDDPQSPSA